MKFKKIVSTFFVFAFVLVFSQSAFALTGVGDTQENAISLFPAPSGDDLFQDIDLYLDSSEDKDWFKWTNTTGENKFLGAYLSSKGRECNFRLGMTIKYTPTRNSNMVYADYIGPGNAQMIDNIIIPPWATVYIKIDSTKFVPEQYVFYFRLYQYK
ncbi:hypothetical protein [Paenibacillus sp. OSY-SE]|uniref:hypothetical protein n=1 Tax=Paenibacillus sp. OSY-SE TaxID=1196323 RepID=UPI0012FB3788|nr:hypothetical protein [Paenibacillus sp. OSY-SE]